MSIHTLVRYFCAAAEALQSAPDNASTATRAAGSGSMRRLG